MSEKPVIIYIGAFELPNKNAAAQRVIANGKIFRDIGYDVVFLGVRKSQSANLNEEYILKEPTYFDFECWSVAYPISAIGWFGYLTAVSPVLFLAEEVYKGRVKGIVNYNHPSVSQFRTTIFCRAKGIAHLADVTEWYDTSAGPFFWRYLKKIDTTFRMYVVNLLVSGLITTSPFITRFYGRRRKVTVQLPTLFDCDQYTFKSVECSPSGVASPGSMNVVFFSDSSSLASIW